MGRGRMVEMSHLMGSTPQTLLLCMLARGEDLHQPTPAQSFSDEFETCIIYCWYRYKCRRQLGMMLIGKNVSTVAGAYELPSHGFLAIRKVQAVCLCLWRGPLYPIPTICTTIVPVSCWSGLCWILSKWYLSLPMLRVDHQKLVVKP